MVSSVGFQAAAGSGSPQTTTSRSRRGCGDLGAGGAPAVGLAASGGGRVGMVRAGVHMVHVRSAIRLRPDDQLLRTDRHDASVDTVHSRLQARLAEVLEVETMRADELLLDDEPVEARVAVFLQFGDHGEGMRPRVVTRAMSRGEPRPLLLEEVVPAGRKAGGVERAAGPLDDLAAGVDLVTRDLDLGIVRHAGDLDGRTGIGLHRLAERREIGIERDRGLAPLLDHHHGVAVEIEVVDLEGLRLRGGTRVNGPDRRTRGRLGGDVGCRRKRGGNDGQPGHQGTQIVHVVLPCGIEPQQIGYVTADSLASVPVYALREHAGQTILNVNFDSCSSTFKDQSVHLLFLTRKRSELGTKKTDAFEY